MSTGFEVAFETVNLSARPPQPEDAPAITAYFQDKDVPWMLGRAPWPYALEDAQTWIAFAEESLAEGTEYAFVLHHPEHGLIGAVGMNLVEDDIWEIGYWIGKPHWGNGYVTEAARGLLDWARHAMGVSRLVSGHIDDNPASGKVLLKLGFEKAGMNRMYVKGRDCEVDAVRYVYGGAPIEVALKVPGH